MARALWGLGRLSDLVPLLRSLILALAGELLLGSPPEMPRIPSALGQPQGVREPLGLQITVMTRTRDTNRETTRLDLHTQLGTTP